jgi:VWFA-related protein
VTLLDLVVRDKKGKLVNDLEPSNITINDNGAKQSISEFRLIQGTEATGAGGAKVALDPLHQVRLVTLVFETMADADLRGATRNAIDPLGAPVIGSQSATRSGSAQGANSGAEADRRRTAQKAVLEFLKTAPPANVYYSVVLLNTQLLVLQPFTQDTTALAKAVERATSGAGASDVASDSNRIKAELSRFVAEHPQRGAGASTPADVQTALARTMLEMLRSTTANAGGPRLTIDALQSLSRGLSGMPGRKAILYFSSGLLLPTHLDLAFNNLKGLANRANVAIYPVDTRGPGANDSAGAQALNSALAASASDDIRAAMHASDAVESAGRANVQLPLRELAEDTGGFLIAESNNLAAPLRRAVEDINNYYEITYDPGITEYDGSFRKVKVDIARKGAVAHGRSGYLSLAPDVRAFSVQPFEVPLLKALAAGVLSKDLGYLAEPVLLQPRTEGTDLSVLIEIPLHVLQAKTDTAQTTIGISFALAALLKDTSGEVVQQLTREHTLHVTAEQMKAGNFIEKLAATVPSGKYTLESVVMDRASGKVGTQHTEFSVAPKSKGVGISSLTPVRSYAPNAKNLSPDEPFQFQGGTITPMLSNTVTRSEKGVLPLFFTVYPDPSIAGASSVDIEFFQNGKSLQKGTLPLPAPDAQGRIPYVFSVPASIPPGTYEIRATARQGDTSSEAKAVVKVEAQ